MPTDKKTTQSYPPGTRWTIPSRYGHVQTEELALYPEINGSSITDDYLPDEITAHELWRKWADKYAGYAHKQWPDLYRPGDVTISWTVTLPDLRGIFEAAPHVPGLPRDPELTRQFGPREPEDFLTHYHQPTHADSGEPVNWLRLPVLDRAWNETAGDKGGFIQELTGWKPSPLQPTVNVIQMARAAGLYVPTLT